MPKSTTFCNDFLALILNSTAITDLAENDATSPNTNVYIALHFANPGAGGSQTTSEVAYTSYARVAVSRNGTGGWNAPSGGATQNAALAQFPVCGVTGATATHVSIGTVAHPSAGKILWSGALNANLTIAQNIQPQFNAGDLTVTEA